MKKTDEQEFYVYGNKKLRKIKMNFDVRKKHAKLLIGVNAIVNNKEDKSELETEQNLSDWIHDNIMELFETFINADDLKFINIEWKQDLNYMLNMKLANEIIQDFFGLRVK